MGQLVSVAAFSADAPATPPPSFKTQVSNNTDVNNKVNDYATACEGAHNNIMTDGGKAKGACNVGQSGNGLSVAAALLSAVSGQNNPIASCLALLPQVLTISSDLSAMQNKCKDTVATCLQACSTSGLKTAVAAGFKEDVSKVSTTDLASLDAYPVLQKYEKDCQAASDKIPENETIIGQLVLTGVQATNACTAVAQAYCSGSVPGDASQCAQLAALLNGAATDASTVGQCTPGDPRCASSSDTSGVGGAGLSSAPGIGGGAALSGTDASQLYANDPLAIGKGATAPPGSTAGGGSGGGAFGGSSAGGDARKAVAPTGPVAKDLKSIYGGFVSSSGSGSSGKPGSGYGAESAADAQRRAVFGGNLANAAARVPASEFSPGPTNLWQNAAREYYYQAARKTLIGQ